MTNTTLAPLENAYKTVLTASIDAVTTTIIVDVAPSITVPAGKKIPAVLDPKNNFREVVFITGIAGSTLTVERGGPDYDGGPSTANAHSAGSTIVITNPFNIFKDYADAIDSKLDSDGGNPTTTWDLDVDGSNFRFRLSAGDMLFTDDNQAEVSLSTLAAAAGVDDKAKVSAVDTTSSYLATKLVAGAGASLNILNPAGNETLEVEFDSSGAGVDDHEAYTPAFLTGGNAPEVVVAVWDSVSDGEFQITIDGVVRNVAGLDFQTPAVLSMADVAAVIQVGIRALTGSTETCTWSGAAFIVSSALTTVASAITVTSTVAAPAGTDISGAGAGAYMDCDAGSTAVITAAVLDPTADAGKLVVLAASGNIGGALVDANTLGLTAKGSLATASDATTKAELAVGSDGEFLSADSTAPGGLAWATAPVEFVGVGGTAPKNINYQLNYAAPSWIEGGISASTVWPAEYEAASTITTGYVMGAIGPTLDITNGDQMRWDDVFTRLTVDWWMAAALLGGDSQYGISTTSAAFTRVDVNGLGCYFFWDTGTTLSIVTADGVANTTTALVGPPDIEKIQNYRIVFTKGVDCKFYLNGVLVGTHTTNLPGADISLIYFGGGLDDDGSGTDKLMLGPCSVSIDI